MASVTTVELWLDITTPQLVEGHADKTAKDDILDADGDRCCTESRTAFTGATDQLQAAIDAIQLCKW